MKKWLHTFQRRAPDLSCQRSCEVLAISLSRKGHGLSLSVKKSAMKHNRAKKRKRGKTFMRNLTMVILIVVLFISLASCSQKDTSSKPIPSNPAQPTQQQNSSDNNQVIPKKENKKPIKQEKKVYENQAFKDIVISDQDQKVIVKGKARVFEGVFQYAIVEGNQTIMHDRYQTMGAPEWGEFTLSFDKAILTKDTELELFVYSAKDGSKTDILKVPLPR